MKNQCVNCAKLNNRKMILCSHYSEGGIRTAVYAEALEREVQLEDGRDKHHYKVYYLLDYTFNDAVKLKLLCPPTQRRQSQMSGFRTRYNDCFIPFVLHVHDKVICNLYIP